VNPLFRVLSLFELLVVLGEELERFYHLGVELLLGDYLRGPDF
jgi:hypothetical protein